MNDIKLPEEVNIDAIMYRVVEVDGMIIFTELYGMAFCGTRMAFHRPKFGCWQVEFMPTFGVNYMMADHIVKAFELVQEWRDDDFGRPYKKSNE